MGNEVKQTKKTDKKGKDEKKFVNHGLSWGLIACELVIIAIIAVIVLTAAAAV